jgi:hypothetical protein
MTKRRLRQRLLCPESDRLGVRSGVVLIDRFNTRQCQPELRRTAYSFESLDPSKYGQIPRQPERDHVD